MTDSQEVDGMEANGLACTLSGPELIQRIQEWREVGSHATSRTLGTSSIVSVYPLDKAIVGKLRRLIETEKDCCSFMDFDVQEADEQLIVELTVPEEMSHVLALMLDVTGAA